MESAVVVWCVCYGVRCVGDIKMKITYDDDQEYWRLERLARVAQFIKSKDPKIIDIIYELNDHEGTLTVTFNRGCSISLKNLKNYLNVIGDAWGSAGEESVEIQLMT